MLKLLLGAFSALFRTFTNFNCFHTKLTTFIKVWSFWKCTFRYFQQLFPLKILSTKFLLWVWFERLKIPFNTDDENRTITDSMLSTMISKRCELKIYERSEDFSEKTHRKTENFPVFKQRKSAVIIQNIFFHIKIFTTTGKAATF